MSSRPDRSPQEWRVDVDLLAPEQPAGGIPREEDHHAPRQGCSGRLVLQPARSVRTGHARFLADALRADDDVREIEVDVRESGEQLRVEARRAPMSLPAMSRLRELVDAVLGERGDEPGQVARVHTELLTAFPDI